MHFVVETMFFPILNLTCKDILYSSIGNLLYFSTYVRPAGDSIAGTSESHAVMRLLIVINRITHS